MQNAPNELEVIYNSILFQEQTPQNSPKKGAKM